MKNELTYKRANELLRFYAESGKLYWKVNRGGTARSGDEAGSVLCGANKRTPYRKVQIDRKMYYAHRIAWLLFYGEWPTHDIDHINGDGLNNRIGNLRDVPASINQRNQRMRRTNTSGVTGVCWDKQAGKWQAYVSINGKLKKIGRFSDIADAEAAVREFRSKHGFTERHGADV